MWLLVLGFGGAGVWMVVASRRRPGEEGSGATIAPAGASAAETIAGAAGGGDWLFSLQGPNGESRERLRLPAVVGRSSSADLTILDAQVSGYHAKLVARAGGVAVVDLGSSNGTFVGDERIGETLLRPGDSFRVGSTTIGFVSGPALDAP